MQIVCRLKTSARSELSSSIAKFNRTLTKDEGQKQALLQVVESHRRLASVPSGEVNHGHD